MSMMESGFCGMIVIMYNWWVWMCFALFFRMPTLMDFIDFHSMFSFLSFLISVGMYSKMVDVVKTCQSTPAFMGNITVAMIQLYTQSMVVVFLTMWWSHPLEFHWYLWGFDFKILQCYSPKLFWNWASIVLSKIYTHICWTHGFPQKTNYCLSIKSHPWGASIS